MAEERIKLQSITRLKQSYLEHEAATGVFLEWSLERMQKHEERELAELRTMRSTLKRLKPEDPQRRAIAEEIVSWLRFHNSNALKTAKRLLEDLQNKE